MSQDSIYMFCFCQTDTNHIIVSIVTTKKIVSF